MHKHEWRVPVAIGVGGTLDFIAGTEKRVPLGPQKIYMEWFWRILANPRRLLKRFIKNMVFLLKAARRVLSVRRMPDKAVTFQPLEDDALEEVCRMGAKVINFITLGTANAARDFCAEFSVAAEKFSIVVDIHSIPWLDSMEVGILMQINRCCREQGHRLILYAPRPKVRRLFETCQLTEYFDFAYSVEEIKAVLNSLIEGILKAIRVDATRLDFIDSSGLGFLIELKKQARTENIAITIDNMGPKPRRALQIARVDRFLLNNESSI